MVASALGLLYYITGESYYLDQAQITLDAAVADLTSGGILKESCDNASGTANCGSDGVRILFVECIPALTVKRSSTSSPYSRSV